MDIQTNWRDIVVKAIGPADKTTTDPIKLIQNVQGKSRTAGGGHLLPDMQRTFELPANGMNKDTSTAIVQAFGGKGSSAEASADALGVGDLYRAGGGLGLRQKG